MTDDSILTFGIYKDKKLSEVPDSYLLWLYNNKKCSKDLEEYIKENLDAIEINTKRNNKFGSQKYKDE
jgi:hypothetical protein